MNYRHAYHAGNFADVLKHAVLAAIVTYLKRKEHAFRVIDTHAGPGLYDLSATEAQKTGEWRGGIGKLRDAELSPALSAFLEPFLSAVMSLNAGADGIRLYPGSPKLVRTLLRKQDRLTAIELHPKDARALKELFAGDFQTRVIELDGWLSLGGHLPPKEKRGLILVDPPFEKDGEYDRLVDGLARAARRFPGGTYCLWYPIKADADTGGFLKKIESLGRPRTLVAELTVRDRRSAPGLTGSGLVIVNPPFTLEAELKAVLPELARLLAQEAGAEARVTMLVGEPPAATD